ncbi:cyclic nucleotide-binding domain-containing protein [Roseofilum casamattae]|uniref:Cyclic nucleotide-binding domain-containing protein n=1 Tax=Roseofilum casamattae BLCC-M143 TaxID=3022442 RepID=A0ABT7BTU0_9CYAN|nr:cyclic nucleotide-binding domain-containing protein [Roseofilum casamattae]MDJ1181911.1 cyclic nucleotide-binding domain-containing protein [Roseofilum casamattae BLCC-M143]
MLEKFALLENFSPTLLEQVEQACDRRTYARGEQILREGDCDGDIYFLLEGTVDIYKLEESTQKNLKFNQLTAGESFGEISFIDGSPRSASVQALTSCELYVLSKQKLVDGAPNCFQILNILSSRITEDIGDRLRFLTGQHASTLQKQIQFLQERNYFGIIFICLAAFFGFNVLLTEVLRDFFPSFDIYSLEFVWSYTIFSTVPIILLMRRFKVPPQIFGITRRKMKKSIVEALIVSFSILLLLYGIAYLGDSINPNFKLIEQFFSFSWRDIVTSETFWSYLPHSYIQELLSRGFVQTSLEQFIGEKRSYKAVICTSYFFAVTHAAYGLSAIVMVFFASLIFGFFYLRTRNLAGVSIVHYLLGYLPVAAQAL